MAMLSHYRHPFDVGFFLYGGPFIKPTKMSMDGSRTFVANDMTAQICETKAMIKKNALETNELKHPMSQSFGM